MYLGVILCALSCVFTGEKNTRAEDSSSVDTVWVDAELPKVVDVYRDFHAHPELSYEEKETAARLNKWLDALGFKTTAAVGGHGVVAILENGDGPTLMLRTDLDGLPVNEETELVYASKNEGVMHACGHDLHIANIIGVARYLADHRDQWQGRVMIIGQPAEERGAGAKAMLEDGLFKRFPKPDFALALHVDASLATGKIAFRGGYAMANVNSVDITMHGKGGHGAYPHATIDPVVQAAELVMSLQTIVSREIKPQDPAVVTVGAIKGGSKHNVISNECHLQLTVRSYTDEVREHLLSAIERKAKAVAEGARAPEPTIKISEGTPALFNDEKLAERLGDVFRKQLGEANVGDADPSMGGEDFSRYGRAGVPILMVRLGSVDAKRLKRYQTLEQQPPSLHSSRYYPDAEAALRTGIQTMASAALELMRP